MQNIRRLLHYYLSVPHVPRRLLVSQLLLAIAVLFELAVPQLVQTMVDDGIAVGDLRVISRAALYMVIASLAATVFYVINAWYATNFSERAAHTLRTRVYQRIQSLSFGNLDRFETSDLLVRLTADVNAAKLVIMNGTTTLLRAPFMILGAVGLLLLTSPGLAWIMVLALLALILILALYTYISPGSTRYATSAWMNKTWCCKRTWPGCAWSKPLCAATMKTSATTKPTTGCAWPPAVPRPWPPFSPRRW